MKTTRAVKYISSYAIQHNLNEIRKIVPERTQIMAVIKANAYGCGMLELAREFIKNGINFFCVATIEEAILLREAGILGKILILGYTHPERIHDIKKYNLIQSIVSEQHGQAMNLQGVQVRCHLQVDTGMHRLGVDPNINKVEKMYSFENLSIEGIYSHLGSSDSLTEEAVLRTTNQIKRFEQLLEQLKEKDISYGLTHIQSSYGILNYPELAFDFVRAGIILYGFFSQPNVLTNTKINLLPVVRIKASLVLERLVDSGEYIGYGLGVKLKKKKRIGVISIGYADGIPRELSNKGLILEYKGQFIRQIGNICMDMLIVDLTGIKDISVNDELTILPDIEKTACDTGTITNELLSRLGMRLEVKL